MVESWELNGFAVRRGLSPRWAVFLAFFVISVVLFLLADLVFSEEVFASTPSQEPLAQMALQSSAPQSPEELEPQPPQDDSEKFATCLVSDKFPPKILQWCGIITFYALKHQLPPDLVAAVMLQESGGNASAYSKSGAVGLMQVMPRDGISETFQCQNGPCFANRPTIAELQDPVFNIRYGTRMLANLIARYGDIREALRAYGPMNVGYTYADKVLAIYHRYQ